MINNYENERGNTTYGLPEYQKSLCKFSPTQLNKIFILYYMFLFLKNRFTPCEIRHST